MKNVPNKIYLNVGNISDSDIDFRDLKEVTWCKDRASSDDIAYISIHALRRLLKERIEYLKSSKIADDTYRDTVFIELGYLMFQVGMLENEK